MYMNECSSLFIIVIITKHFIGRVDSFRYLHVRWGLELSKVVVFVGELGDSDYEGSFGGVPKTVTLKGYCVNAAKIHSNCRSYPLHHVVSTDDPNSNVECQKCDVDGIKAALAKLAHLKQ